MKKEIILIGGGGHCRSCVDVIEQGEDYTIAGIVDVPERKGDVLYGYEIVADDAQLPDLVKRFQYFLITIGQIKSSLIRRTLYQTVRDSGGLLPVIISPYAYVSSHARISDGTLVMHHAIVNAGAVIGENCILNTRSLVEHDAVVGNHCHLSPGAILNGGVSLGDGVFIGSGSVVRENVHIGDNCIIGCNETVKFNLEPGALIR